MKKHGQMAAWSLSIIVGAILGIQTLVQPLARQMAYDPNEYCEDQGIYFRDAGETFTSIRSMGQDIIGFDYAYVCYIHNLHIEELKQFPNLVRYGVTYGRVTDVPSTIGDLTKLTRLQIHNQRITTLPSSIGNLTNLHTLLLGGNRLKHLPQELGNLTNLRLLHIYGNAIETIPASIGNLMKLEQLDARHNKLTTLPSEITNLKDTLTILYLGGNHFSPEEQSRIKRLLPNTTIYF
jgi:Leucine-rich repeat (LRR) protein